MRLYAPNISNVTFRNGCCLNTIAIIAVCENQCEIKRVEKVTFGLVWGKYFNSLSTLFCHAELVSASYQFGVSTTFRQAPEINSGRQNYTIYPYL